MAQTQVGASMDTKKTIMVVDDNPDIITIVKTILEPSRSPPLSPAKPHRPANAWATQAPSSPVAQARQPIKSPCSKRRASSWPRVRPTWE